MTAQQLRDQIRLAFPATQFYGPITTCDCAECTDITEELRHQRWDEVSTAFLDLTCSPTLLTPEAFSSFLPAYLLRALDDLNQHSVVVEFTVYSLCPHQPEEDDQQTHLYQVNEEARLLQRARLMSPAQIQAVQAFLVFVQDKAGDAEWFRPFIASALEKIWR